jgi:hypothetical protein
VDKFTLAWEKSLISTLEEIRQEVLANQTYQMVYNVARRLVSVLLLSLVLYSVKRCTQS